jgi:hypothetical protein
VLQSGTLLKSAINSTRIHESVGVPLRQLVLQPAILLQRLAPGQFFPARLVDRLPGHAGHLAGLVTRVASITSGNISGSVFSFSWCRASVFRLSFLRLFRHMLAKCQTKAGLWEWLDGRWFACSCRSWRRYLEKTTNCRFPVFALSADCQASCLWLSPGAAPDRLPCGDSRLWPLVRH